MPSTILYHSRTTSLSNSVPSLSLPPVLSTRGQHALNRPPLLKCSLFENQFADSNPHGYINLGVAENVRIFEELAQVALIPPQLTHSPLSLPKSLCTSWLTEFFESHFKLDYSDFTYGKDSFPSDSFLSNLPISVN